MSEEKRRVENRLTTMEEELEEEQNNNEATLDKARKALQQVDTLTSEVASLQSNLNQSESAKISYEKQVKIIHIYSFLYMYCHEVHVYMLACLVVYTTVL